MHAETKKKKIFGWMMFDWASQPYNTLLLTFIFGPYFAEIVSNQGIAAGVEGSLAKAYAQSFWTLGLTISGVIIALLAPILGAVADSTGRRMPYIYVFSLLYVLGSGSLWIAYPDASNTTLILGFFIVGLIGMEFATAFTNAIMPELGRPDQLGRISGNGFAIGYVGGLVALVIVLCLLAENNQGRTLIGIKPILGLDTEMREGTRSVGPFTALWYIAFMVPFFLWVRSDHDRLSAAQRGTVREGLEGLKRTLKKLPESPSFAAYLGSSMLYRDGLSGMYTIGGVYAYGVLGWSVVDVGTFGILTITCGALFSYLGGYADSRFGPKPVITGCIIFLCIAAVGIVSISRQALLGFPVAETSMLPDLAFYVCGAIIGSAGGVLQAASRTMLVRQANPDRMTEAFGIYALAGKATAFLAPALISAATAISGSQRVGVSPVLGLFLIALLLLIWVKPEGEDKAVWDAST